MSESSSTATQTRSTATETPPGFEQPRSEHTWLRRLIGEWTYKMSAAQPGQPAQEATGTESVRPIGYLWISAETEGQMPGAGAMTSVMTLGYNPATKRFVGTWIGSMMTHMWIYDGELDPSGRVLTLSSEGPSMENDGTMRTYQDVIEFKTDDHRVQTSRVQGKDGTWQTFMTVDYKRIQKQ